MLKKNHFLLDPNITFLNHGSFGACPKPVFDIYQQWQRKLEERPIEFLGRNAFSLLAESREKLADYLNCAARDLVYFPNPSTAINMVVPNLDLQPGDEILTTDHEYRAMDRTWRYFCAKSGAKYIQRNIPLPVTTHADFVENFWAGVTPKTKIIFLSHITSSTALVFPVTEICKKARKTGILCIVDGAHAPAQIDLDLSALNADIYTGACHKWMLSPKGAAFLYVRRELQDSLDPLVISWGYDSESGFGSGIQYIDYHEWQGTRDIAAFLSVPAAIDYQREQDWGHVRARCRNLLGVAVQKVQSLTGLPPIAPYPSAWYGQMAALSLPKGVDGLQLKTRLYDEYNIEIPFTTWGEQSFLRISIQSYNNEDDVDKLADALKVLLP
ncbi:MAG: aminotransferase class V-fold PLP-dependent enzyme [Anaerolineae bacterium]|jgi:isopenicillin-N epimerase|nr:aminotransferase class V-fold PLP-dependent enzyme [Anaerolineae bacterium]MBT7190066.1 aminotransferase class V-fold PLP-dependent enzyme [Anaerolineae bacterium]MBT7988947.1 aminotransferase class V-fold PLP-dependent enzyme [Anaerolineae bacterium]